MQNFHPIIFFLAILLSFIFGVWKLTEYVEKSNRQIARNFKQVQATKTDTTATDSAIGLGEFHIPQ